MLLSELVSEQTVWRHNLLWRQRWLLFSSRPLGLSGIDKVVPDWIKIQSFVFVRSFLSDVDGLKDFLGAFSSVLRLGLL